MNEALELEFVYEENAILGSTLTLRETKVVLEGIALKGKSTQQQADAIAEREALAYASEIATSSLHTIERAARFLLVGDPRTGRLLMNLELLRGGYPLAIIREEDQPTYFEGLNQAVSGNFESLTNLVAAAVQRSIEQYLNLLDRD